jgi:phosphate transport system substrate-binding protein
MTTRTSFARPSRLGGLVAALAASLALAACGSSGSGTSSTSAPGGSGTSGSTSTTQAPPNPASQLAALEKPPASAVSLSEDGSSLLYPLFQSWATAYHAAHSTVTASSGSDGSGTGIADAESGVVDIGASDAYLPPATYSQYPTLENIPVAISAQVAAYNLPGFATKHLKLSGSVLSAMYDGSIKSWDDPAIKALNPGVTLPSLAIVPIHRSDSSGDTFLFTSFLTASYPSGWAAKNGGPSTSASFPSVSGALAEKGNSGMVAGCGATKGCIAYIGISYLKDFSQAGLGYAALQNKSGKFEVPTAATIDAAAASFTNVPANGSISLIYGPASGGYPIINFEYLMAKTNQSSTTKATAIKALIAWAMDPKGGNSATYLGPVYFQPLPPGALAVAINLVKKIS